MYKITQKGFTLIEVLLVVALLALLAAITIVAINPARQFAQTRDKQRVADVYTILNAIHQYAADHDGSFPEVITTDSLEICRTINTTCDTLYDVSVLTENQDYLVTIPIDPSCVSDGAPCSVNGAGYFLRKTTEGRISVSAPGAEGTNSISVTR